MLVKTGHVNYWTIEQSEDSLVRRTGNFIMSFKNDLKYSNTLIFKYVINKITIYKIVFI